MPYILDISTASPEFSVTNQGLVKFYAEALESIDIMSITRKINLFSEKTKIINRYSCIPDFNGNERELFTDGNYNQPVEKRMAVYKKKIIPLAVKAIDKLLVKSSIEPSNITHLITVSCTGLFAPGLEFFLAEHYGLQHTEKAGINFLGCYAAIKALKQAYYITQANPEACVLIVCAELCSLHFFPSASEEDMVANLLFADGAAAAIVCGNENRHIKNKMVLDIEAIGSACVPNTMHLMTWNISSSAFRMYLSKNIANEIKNNIEPVVNEFLSGNEMEYWAIHPGGVRIVQAVKESLELSQDQVTDSMNVLEQYGNMSSPTILFILNKIFQKIRMDEDGENKKVFACAFGPGISIEMLSLSAVHASNLGHLKNSLANYAE